MFLGEEHKMILQELFEVSRKCSSIWLWNGIYETKITRAWISSKIEIFREVFHSWEERNSTEIRLGSVQTLVVPDLEASTHHFEK